MKFSRHLYIGRMANSNRLRILWDLRLRHVRPLTYVILLKNTEHAQIELIHNAFLARKHFPRKQYTVYGFAEGKREGLSVLQDIVNDAYEKGWIEDLPGYLRTI